MYEYTYDGTEPKQSETIWSRHPLQPFSDVLTPFSYSVLAEISRRAWFHYYERLGYDLPFVPRTIVRHHYGRPYLNIKWICEQDAAFAGLPPMQFRVDGEWIAVCAPNRSGLLAGFRNSRNQRKLTSFLQALDSEMDDITARARTWYTKIAAMRWTQAEILQIMEEIERVGVESLAAFYAARHNLERAYNALLRMEGTGTLEQRLCAINNTLSDLQGLEELRLARDLLELADLARRNESLTTWLADERFEGWEANLPEGVVGRRLVALMENYGHWANGEGEMANPRWREQPRFLFKGILACARTHARQPARVPSGAAIQQVLGAIDDSRRQEAEQHLEQIRRLSVLQSRALNAFAFILAGTRQWAMAAGQEAMGDGRLYAPDETFLFALEELKQMMTGEWNVANVDEIRATVAERRAQFQAWQKAQPGDLLFDDAEGYPVRSGLPGVVGTATGPLRRQKELQPCLCQNAVVGAHQIDSGWTPALPVAGALLSASGTPLDPIVAAARVWHVPTVVALGPHYNQLVDGAQTTINGAAGAVEQ